MGNINIDLPAKVHRQLKAHCALKGITLEQYFSKALERRLNRQT